MAGSDAAGVWAQAPMKMPVNVSAVIIRSPVSGDI